MIPDNISPDHIIKALKQIDQEGIPSHRKSTKHNLIHEGKQYPPKLVLSKANIYANKQELDASVFSGGDETNTYLSALGFEILTEHSFKRNPPWQRDELILALDLYFRYHPNTISQRHSEVVKLSEVLNSLPIHINRLDQDKFRNPNGVYMKLCNFLRFDPAYQGIGLVSGGKLEEHIWREFSSDRAKLRKLANIITNSVSTTKIEDNNISPEEEEFPEGKILYRLHRRRERSKELVKKAKQKRKKEVGVLSCDVCGFNFLQSYGDIGADYIECHHTKPVSELEDGGKSKLQDLALVCANCHRMLHRKRPWLSLEQLKQLLQRQL